MCDLWKNTLSEPTPSGAIKQQLLSGFRSLVNLDPSIDSDSSRELTWGQTPFTQLKLYNSGNFFDASAIPREEHSSIAEWLNRQTNDFQVHNVIVENHPSLCGPHVFEFQRMLEAELELAIGLETVHPQILKRLNKSMTAYDFQVAVEKLISKGINVRAFILLMPPFLLEEATSSEIEHQDEEKLALEWALRSIDFAYSAGVNCCSVIPTRTGNGIMDELKRRGNFREPRLRLMEQLMECGLQLKSNNQRLFIDLWNAERFSSCQGCFAQRIHRLNQINFSQKSNHPEIECRCGALDAP